MNLRDTVCDLGHPAGRRGMVVDFDRKGIVVVRWQNGLTTHHHSGEIVVVGDDAYKPVSEETKARLKELREHEADVSRKARRSV